MFSVLSFRIEHKKLLKIKHQCTFVYIMNLQFFVHFGFFLLLCGLVSDIFTIFSGVQKYVSKDVIHTVILAM